MTGPRVMRKKRLCRRIGCENKFEVVPSTKCSEKQKFCSRECIPQSSSGPKYPYKLWTSCHYCLKKFRMTIQSLDDRISVKVCKPCKQSAAVMKASLKWDEVEIVYLAMINRGVGINEFTAMLYGNQHRRWTVVNYFLSLQQSTGIDLYEIIQDTIRPRPKFSWGTLRAPWDRNLEEE